MLLTVMKHGSSRPCWSSTAKVALVILQRRNQHFTRQREEALFEATGQRYRPFHQRRDFIQQRIADQCAPAELHGHAT